MVEIRVQGPSADGRGLSASEEVCLVREMVVSACYMVYKVGIRESVRDERFGSLGSVWG